MSLGLRLYASLFQRTAEQGARTIVSAVAAAAGSGAVPAEAGRTSAGAKVKEYVQGGFWNDDAWVEPRGEILGTAEGEALGRSVCDEVCAVLGRRVPEVKRIIDGGAMSDEKALES